MTSNHKPDGQADTAPNYDQLAREMMDSWQRVWKEQWQQGLQAAATEKPAETAGDAPNPLAGWQSWLQEASAANLATWQNMAATMGDTGNAHGQAGHDTASNVSGAAHNAGSAAHHASPENGTGTSARASEAGATPAAAASGAGDVAVAELARRVSELELRVEQLTAQLKLALQQN